MMGFVLLHPSSSSFEIDIDDSKTLCHHVWRAMRLPPIGTVSAIMYPT
jgi:hypothetical protein